MKHLIFIALVTIQAAASLMITSANSVYAQDTDPSPNIGSVIAQPSPSCRGLFNRETGELIYDSNWIAPIHGQTTAEYLLSFPPLTIGFVRVVSPTQTHDTGQINFTATPVAMRFVLLDAHNQTLLRLACTLVVV